MKLQTIAITLAGIVLIGATALGLAVWLGGPAPIAALPSINNPFKGVDYSTLPGVQHYPARDGATLAYRHYAPTSADAGRRIVLIHGSSASSRSMHALAQALAAAGYTVDALDVRGHGESGPHGQIAYIGQLEDDLADLMRGAPFLGPSTLVGFSSGGGFALRFAASSHAALFDHYVLLSPFLLRAPTNRPANADWASVGIPRIVASMLLNKIGITAFNHLTTLQFALNDEAKKFLTPSYSYALGSNFGTHLDYAQDIERAPNALKVVIGANDELMFPQRYAEVFSRAGKTVPVTIVPGAGHMGITLNPAALQAIVAASKA